MLSGITLALGLGVPKYRLVRDWDVFLHDSLSEAADKSKAMPPIFAEATSRLFELVKHTPGVHVSAIRIGSPHCERELPSPSSIDESVDLARNTGVEISIELPVIPQSGWNRYAKIVDFVAHTESGIQLVLNDIGALAHAVSAGVKWTSAGRLLWKQKRLARFLMSELELLGQDVNAEYQTFEPCQCATEFPVRSVELDLLPQGVLLGGAGESTIYWHVPWCVVTFGRICHIGSVASSADSKFRLATRCRHECGDLVEIYENDSWPRPLVRYGKMVYCLCEMGDFGWIEHPATSGVVLDVGIMPWSCTGA